MRDRQRDQPERNETRGGWYVRQMLGSANLTGGRLFHLLSGNLSHQIEHHLLPDVLAHRYAEIAVGVREICARYRLPYIHEVAFPLPDPEAHALRKASHGRETMRNGLMMDDYPLTLTSIIERAERFHADSEVMSRRPSGAISRTTLGACARRARRLAGALAELGVRDGDPVATLLWNQTEHLELYFAVPAMGAVIHTLNPRLHPEELGYIVEDAHDKAIVVDESLLEIFESFNCEVISSTLSSSLTKRGAGRNARLRGAGRGRRIARVARSTNERAAAMCYTSGTTGRPKGVVYSHRALVLHSLVAALPDQLPYRQGTQSFPSCRCFTRTRGDCPTPRHSPARLWSCRVRAWTPTAYSTCAPPNASPAGVPTVWMAMLASLDAEPDRWDLSAPDRLVVGGSAVPRGCSRGSTGTASTSSRPGV